MGNDRSSKKGGDRLDARLQLAQSTLCLRGNLGRYCFRDQYVPLYQNGQPHVKVYSLMCHLCVPAS